MAETYAERYEREKREDMAYWEEYLLTGEAIAHEKVMLWLRDLAQGKAGIQAGLPASSRRKPR